MLEAYTARRYRPVTWTLFVLAALSATVAGVIGFDGNRTANTLGWSAAGLLVLSLAHPWRRAKEYRYLFYAAGLGFLLLVVLHGLLDLAAGAAAGVPVAGVVLEGLSVCAFFGAVYLCPPALGIGLVGAVLFFFWNRKQDTDPGPAA